MRVFEYQLLTDGDMSGDITTDPQQMVNMSMAAVQAYFTGSSPTGTLTIQASNDQVNWSDLADATPLSITDSGNYMWNIHYIGFPYLRLVYTSVSGTGTLNITVNGKGE